MEELSEIKAGWVSMRVASEVIGTTRENIYYWLRKCPSIRTRYNMARREIRIEDLLAARIGEPETEEATE